jgi:hypothetical protein
MTFAISRKQKMYVFQLINQKLEGQHRLDAREFVADPKRRAADLTRLIGALELLPDLDSETMRAQRTREPRGAPRGRPTMLSPTEKAELRADRRAGMPLREIAEKYNIVYSTAWNYAHDVVVEVGYGTGKGRRLAPEVRDQVRADRQLGFGYVALGAKYNIHHTTAWKYAHDVVVTPQPIQAKPPTKKEAETVVTTRKDDSVALAKRCEDVGWDTEYTSKGIKVKTPNGGSYTIHMSFSDRRSLANAVADLQRLGLKEAEEGAVRQRAVDRAKAIAKDRAANEDRAARLAAAKSQQEKAMLLKASGPYLGEPEDVPLEWFTQPHPAPWMRWVWMTPELAGFLLEYHNKPGGAGVAGTNRPKSEATIRHYRDVIFSRQWHLTHQGMASDTTGMVQDGQHRMAAIVAAAELDPDIRVPVAYFVGMDPSNFKAIDEGLTRTAAQLFAMGGEKNGSPLKSALRLIIAYRSGDESARNRWRLRNTNAQLIDAFAADPEILREGAKLAVANASKVPMSGGAFTALHYLLYTANGVDNRYVTAFLHGISRGTLLNNARLKLEEDDPRESLRRTLQSFKEKNDRAASILDQLGLGILAWNMMVQGTHRRMLRWPKGTEIPQVIICKDTPGAVPPRALTGEITDAGEVDGGE